MSAFADRRDLVLNEVGTALREIDPGQIDRLVDQFRSTDTWFCGGQGRSGLVARMTAMRLMHLGRAVHVIGDTTTPAIRGGDGALILSASGRTTTSIAHARAIKERQAVLAVVTCSASSELAALGDIVVTVPAATSRQFGGSLFEQTALIMLDTVALALESDDASARVAMQRRHANLE